MFMHKESVYMHVRHVYVDVLEIRRTETESQEREEALEHSIAHYKWIPFKQSGLRHSLARDLRKKNRRSCLPCAGCLLAHQAPQKKTENHIGVEKIVLAQGHARPSLCTRTIDAARNPRVDRRYGRPPTRQAVNELRAPPARIREVVHA